METETGGSTKLTIEDPVTDLTLVVINKKRFMVSDNNYLCVYVCE